jgi:membrane protein
MNNTYPQAAESKPRSAWRALVGIAQSFFSHEPFQRAAALSYYSLLSIAPLLLVVTGVFGLLVNEAWFRLEIVAQTQALVGSEGAALLETFM